MLRNKFKKVSAILLIVTIIKTVLQAVLWQFIGYRLTFSFLMKLTFSASITYIFDFPATFMWLGLFFGFLFSLEKFFKINIWNISLLSIFAAFMIGLIWDLPDCSIFFRQKENWFVEIIESQKNHGGRFMILIFSTLLFSTLYFEYLENMPPEKI
jgi:hypothetical protein